MKAWLLVSTLLPAIALAQPQAEVRTYSFTGTGFIINTNGHVVTNNHVVDHGCERLTILTPRGEIAAKIVAQDKPGDLAVLQAPYTPVRTAPLRWNIADLKPGDGATLIGYPGQDGARGIERITQTEVLGLKGPVGEPNYINLKPSASHGNSGGPVLDGNGNVIGVITAIETYYKVDQQGTQVGETMTSDVAITLHALQQFLRSNRIPFRESSTGNIAYSDHTLHDRVRGFIVPIRCSFTDKI